MRVAEKLDWKGLNSYISALRRTNRTYYYVLEAKQQRSHDAVSHFPKQLVSRKVNRFCVTFLLLGYSPLLLVCKRNFYPIHGTVSER
jgi:hypothetical protein